MHVINFPLCLTVILKRCLIYSAKVSAKLQRFTVDLLAPTETLSLPASVPRCTVTVAQLCVILLLAAPSGGSSYLGHWPL